MDTRAVWSTFSAKAGKEQEVEAFLNECRQQLEQEQGTTTFFVLSISPGKYATFDTFVNEDAFQAHLHGPTAKAVMERAADLFTAMPTVTQVKVLAAKWMRPAQIDPRLHLG